MFLILLFGIGALIFLYPTISDRFYRIKQSKDVQDFTDAGKKLDDADVEERMRLAKLYNDSLINPSPSDPYTACAQKEGRRNYAHMLEVREKIGIVDVPSADITLPIYAGTSNDVLERGAGHLEGTSLPVGGEGTNAVITAHSGLPWASLFTDLHKVKIGDIFTVENIKERLAYEVEHIETIRPDEISTLQVVENRDLVTLLTCTPVGVNSHRLIIRGRRIAFLEHTEPVLSAMEGVKDYWMIFLICFVFFLLLLFLVKQKKR